jgi:hypothetical protein
MDVKANAAARRTQREPPSDESFISVSARGCEPKPTVGPISGYLNRLGVKFVSKKYGRDVEQHNCRRILNLKDSLQA